MKDALKKARDLGYKVWVDAGLVIGHLNGGQIVTDLDWKYSYPRLLEAKANGRDIEKEYSDNATNWNGKDRSV